MASVGSDFLDLLADNDSAAGLAVTTAAIVVAAVGLRLALLPFVRRRSRTTPMGATGAPRSSPMRSCCSHSSLLSRFGRCSVGAAR